MPDVSPQHHAYMLSTIRRLQIAVLSLRASNDIKKDYLGFDIVQNTLAVLNDAVSKTRDRDQIAAWLNEADGQLAFMGGADVAPAVKQARGEFKSMLSVLAKLRGGSAC